MPTDHTATIAALKELRADLDEANLCCGRSSANGCQECGFHSNLLVRSIVAIDEAVEGLEERQPSWVAIAEDWKARAEAAEAGLNEAIERTRAEERALAAKALKLAQEMQEKAVAEAEQRGEASALSRLNLTASCHKVGCQAWALLPEVQAAEAALATALEEATALRARVTALETDEAGLTELAKSIEDSTAEELSLVWKALGFASWEDAGGKKAHEVVATALEALEEAGRVIGPFAKEADRYEPDDGDGGQDAWATIFAVDEIRAAKAWRDKYGKQAND